jgi:hypothetical protein
MENAMESTDTDTAESYLSTREASGLLGIAPDSMRTYLAKQGNVYGIEPVKSEGNGRLMWPVSEVLRTRDARRA